MATLYPEVAREADGWDPATITAGNNAKRQWLCKDGHTWNAVVNSRTHANRGCPFCAGQRAIPGVNDLATLYPEVAKEADGWDPSVVAGRSHKKLRWRCEKGHTWSATVTNRTAPGSCGCPYCGGKKVLAGFNDLATLFPLVAAEADGWDASTVSAGSDKRLKWRCTEGHTWSARIYHRVPPTSSGCPTCADYGFKPGQPAWFYLLERPGEQQIGVTNVLGVRLNQHARKSWQKLEVVGPFPGDQVLAFEKKLKEWLRKEVGLVPGTHENWFTTKLEVQSLAELKARSGVETDLF